MRYFTICSILMLFTACSDFNWESRGGEGEKCFDNGTCEAECDCIDGICIEHINDNEISDDIEIETDDDFEITSDDDLNDETVTPDDNETDEESDDETVIIPDDDVVEEPTFYDTVTGLTWQIAYSSGTFTWDEAVGHCNGLIYAGSENWHLPTISELRSLVSGCNATDSTGGCNVKDTCLDYGTCRNEPDCNGCEYGKGPSQYKCYFSGIEGSCVPVWSGSTPPAPYSETHAWYMDFSLARLSTDQKTKTGVYYAVCVR